MIPAGGVTAPCSVQGARHPSASLFGQHSGMVHADSEGPPEESCFDPLERLG
jgi:hypothetical protein